MDVLHTFLGLLAVFSFYLVYRVLKWFTIPYFVSTQRKHCTKNYTFKDENEKENIFPLLHQSGTLDLSLVVPAYNEEDRLPVMLEETVKYFQQQTLFSTWEIILVCDGCHDKTAEIGQKYTKKIGSEKIRVLEYKKNMGKGYAVQQGVLHSRGKLILFADADGASEISHVERLVSDMEKINSDDGLGIAVGSRAHLAKESEAKRTFLRTFLMHGFHYYVHILGVSGIQDTQCGFKLFTRKAAFLCFGSQNLTRWLFDIELLLLAQWNSIPVKETQIQWQEIDGSKLGVLEASLSMGRDLIILRLCYFLRLWTVKSKLEIEAFSRRLEGETC